MRFDILNRSGMYYECDRQTDGRTDGRTDERMNRSSLAITRSNSPVVSNRADNIIRPDRRHVHGNAALVQ